MSTKEQYEKVFWKKPWNKKEETMRNEIEAELWKKESSWFKVWEEVLDTKYNKNVVVTEIILDASKRIKNRWTKI